jgi:hypothetical protein
VFALEVLGTLFDKTEHNSYFKKINFGSKQKFRHMKNTTLYLVVLTWLQHLHHQCFVEKSDLDPRKYWNKYEWYYGTGSGFTSDKSTLSNINRSTVKSETHTPVTDVFYFKPNEDRTDVVTSLEEWAARLLKPNITDILKIAKADSNTKKNQRAKTSTTVIHAV